MFSSSAPADPLAVYGILIRSAPIIIANSLTLLNGRSSSPREAPLQPLATADSTRLPSCPDLDGAALARLCSARKGDDAILESRSDLLSSARMAMQGPAERYAFLPRSTRLSPAARRALRRRRRPGVVRLLAGGGPGRDAQRRRRAPPLRAGRLQLGLWPYAQHPHVERRYLVVPGLRSSRIHIIDTKPDPKQPKIVKVSSRRSDGPCGYSRLHTCTARRTASTSGPRVAPRRRSGRHPRLDHDSFNVSALEVDRGPQQLPTTSPGTWVTTP